MMYKRRSSHVTNYGLKTALFIVSFFVLSNIALAQVSGTFMVVKGDVQVQGADGKTEKAKVGKKIFPKDTIVAGADSRAKVVMSDKNVINVSPDTKIVLEKYIFDEATSNLDTATEREIQEHLKQIAKQKTTLIIAHRLSTITHADEIIVLSDGIIAEQGTHATLTKQQGIYARLWHNQNQ